MPYVIISASQGLPADQKKQLLQGASDAVVESIGAPLTSVRVMLHELGNGHYLNAGVFDTQALMYQVDFIEGRTEEQKSALIAALSRSGNAVTGMPESEVRVRVVDYPKANMGMAGGVSAKQAGR
ncbi:tautomerase family protein [Pusillimonas sp. ANT_WB101]|uniref:tautomerase family protein n=1 Tax=Pusillimonas sp. ANT_WB101 TaxID=2597356 RepID=UPI0011F05F07|nr:tautomerase family protein [Pusillimonas sp. ANT_WB101]KAA0910717.1 tautomerase [Pusillimonas sp. ANT_WB101]